VGSTFRTRTGDRAPRGQTAASAAGFARATGLGPG